MFGEVTLNFEEVVKNIKTHHQIMFETTLKVKVYLKRSEIEAVQINVKAKKKKQQGNIQIEGKRRLFRVWVER